MAGVTACLPVLLASRDIIDRYHLNSRGIYTKHVWYVNHFKANMNLGESSAWQDEAMSAWRHDSERSLWQL